MPGHLKMDTIDCGRSNVDITAQCDSVCVDLQYEVEIVFKDGVGYDTQKLLDSVKGHYGEF